MLLTFSFKDDLSDLSDLSDESEGEGKGESESGGESEPTWQSSLVDAIKDSVPEDDLDEQESRFKQTNHLNVKLTLSYLKMRTPVTQMMNVLEQTGIIKRRLSSNLPFVSHTWMLLHVSLIFSPEGNSGDDESEGERNDTRQSKPVFAMEDITPMLLESRFNCMEKMYEDFLTTWVCGQLFKYRLS